MADGQGKKTEGLTYSGHLLYQKLAFRVRYSLLALLPVGSKAALHQVEGGAQADVPRTDQRTRR